MYGIRTEVEFFESDNNLAKMVTINYFEGRAWRCGYIGVNKNHPWYGRDYDELDNELETYIHGGLTFAGPIERSGTAHYYVGFDCAHAFDDLESCSLQYVKGEVERLAAEAAAAA